MDACENCIRCFASGENREHIETLARDTYAINRSSVLFPKRALKVSILRISYLFLPTCRYESEETMIEASAVTQLLSESLVARTRSRFVAPVIRVRGKVKVK